MPKLWLDGRAYDREDGETVLDALLRQGVDVSYSCKRGTCFTCLVRAPGAAIPAMAQRGLRRTMAAEGYVLSCCFQPVEEELTILRPRDAEVYGRAIVRAKLPASRTAMRLFLEPATALYYHPGQFINVRRADGLTRSYSLASVPRTDPLLELHVRRMNNGAMSRWLFDQLAVGDTIDIAGPYGECFYLENDASKPMLLIGSGIGASPLVGILRDALHAGHTGPMHLYVGSRTAEGLYLQEELRRLAQGHSNFHYEPCVSGPDVPAGHHAGRADDVALARHPDLEGFRVFLCGVAPMVHAARKRAYLAGAWLSDIHAESFDLRDLRAQQQPGWDGERDRRRHERAGSG
jgi:NAD(P)H-flavin reductase/ferredoxin